MRPGSHAGWTIGGLEDQQASTPDPEGGFGALSTGRGNLPLEALTVRIAISALTTAHTTIAQTYRNPYDEPLEAVYIFPLPDRAALTSLRLEADDHTVAAELRERGQARDSYDRAIAAGQRAALAEEERPGVFTLRVGNILPGERVMVHLVTVAPLDWEGDEAEYRFPLVVAPRYIPGTPLPGPPVGEGTEADTDDVPDASRITPPVLLPGFPHPVRLDIEVDVDSGDLGPSAVRSTLPLRSVTEGGADSGRDGDGDGDGGGEGAGGALRLRVEAGARADRDLVLRLRPARQRTTAAVLSVAPDRPGSPEGDPGATAEDDPPVTGTGSFTVTVLPPPGAVPDRPRDVVIVLDRSGSMAGWKMAAARSAAARVVTSLTSRDRFSVIAFDHAVEEPRGLLPTGSAPGMALVPASARNRARAAAFLAELAARGGTELLGPLLTAADRLAAGRPPAEDGDDRDRLLVLLTDGQVGNEDQVLRRLAGRLRGARVHTIGVDTAVNEGFLRRLATLGRGRCRLVESPARLEEAMEQVHRTLAAPLVDGLTVEAVPQPGAEEPFRIVPGTLAPARLPALHPGVPVTLTGRYHGTPGQIAVLGTDAAGSPWRTTADPVPDRTGATAALWARAHLRDLEDAYVTAEPSLWTTGPAHDQRSLALERRMADISLRFSVLCRFTAYVAVDTRTVASDGSPRIVVQPVEPAAGWAMFGAPAPPPAAPGGPFRGAARAARAPGGPPGAGGFLPVPPTAAATQSTPPREEQPPAPGPRIPIEFLRRIRDELDALRTGSEQEAEGDNTARLVQLRALGARLTALLAELVAQGVPDNRLTPLWEAAELLQPLVDGEEPTADELESMGDRVAELLLVFDADARSERREPPRHRAFWRR